MSSDENVKTSRPPIPGAPAELPFRQIDRYEIEAFLGAGAMGQVYRAVHTVTKRVCALKLLPDELSKQPSFVTRFHHEAQILARMNHPNIVQIYSGGEAAGKLFLEMEFIDGGDLQRRIHAQAAGSTTPTGLPEDEVRRILDGVLGALDFAHKQQVVHRDLKPANILLQKDGTVKVSDFGLAAAAGVDFQRSQVRESLTLTKVTSMETVVSDPGASSSGSGSSSFAGTILYMSPEALRGEAPDPRDDLFSVGVIAYYLLTGKTPSVNYKPVSRARPQANKAWDAFITHCLEEERASRFQTAAVARNALPQAGKRSMLPALLGTAALVLVLGVAVVGGAAYYFWPRIKSLTSRKDPASAKVDAPPPASDRARANNDSDADPRTAASNRAPAANSDDESATTTRSSSPSSASSTSSSSAAPASLTADSRSTETSPADSGNSTSGSAPSSSSSSSSSASDAGFAGHELTPIPPRAGEADTAGNATGHELTPLPDLRGQSITFPRPPDLVLGEGPFELRATTSSGLPVQFVVVSGPARIDGNRLIASDAGGVTVRASQAGNSEFSPADSVTRTIRVAKSRSAIGTASAASSSPAQLSPAEKAQFGETVGTISIPEGLSQAKIREAIGFALGGRGWTITEKNHLKIVGFLRHRSNEATLTFLYSGSEIELYCVGYAINKTTGERKNPEVPTGWINYLKKDLTRLLNDAAASSR